MDGRRFLLAVVLMIAVMFGVNVLFPPPAPVPTDGAAVDTIPATTADTAPAPVIQDTIRDPGRLTASSVDTVTGAPTGVVADDTVRVRSSLFEYLVSSRSAALLGAELLRFPVLREGRENETVQLAAPGMPPLFSYTLRVGTRDIPFASLGFTAIPPDSLILGADTSRTISLSHRGNDGLGVDVLYTFNPDDYTIDVRIAVTGTAGQVPNLYIALPRTLALNEDDVRGDERALAYVVNNEREGIHSVRLSDVEAERVENGPLLWAAVKNKYFVTAILAHGASQTPFGGLIARPVTDPNAADMVATLLPGSDGTFSFRIYAGPQEPQRLAALENGFQDVNPFGYRVFRPILRPFVHAIQWALYGLHSLLGIGYGWVLILFGILIRVAMWPLNAKAMRSQMKTMEIQPKLKEIQARYKDQPEQLQKEMLKLYKTEGFNPMGGCLPMLVPMPILITLFFVFQSTIAFRGVGFLWLPDLSRADPLYILPIVLGLSMFLTQWITTRSMTEQNPQMKMMMYLMPIVMVVFFFQLPSGLNLYYASMNFASLPQQMQIAKEKQKLAAKKAS